MSWGIRIPMRDGIHLKATLYFPAELSAVSGFFRLSACISIDQQDTDFCVSIYESSPGGSSLLLTRDYLRTRYQPNAEAAR